MAKTITQLPDATVVNAADELIIQQGGVTKRATKTEVLNGIVNANVDAAAAIAGTKVSPDFGSQNAVTTGTMTAAKLIPTGNSATGNGVYLPAANAVGISTDGTERVRILSTGNVLVGASAAQNFASDSTDSVEVNPAGWVGASRNANPSLYLRRRTNNGAVAEFYRTNTVVGSITVDTTQTAYNTSSDYRLKDNAAPLTTGLNTVDQLNPVEFVWKSNGSTGRGFIAHELQAVVPESVSGEKDAVDADGNAIYQGVDASKLVPYLVSAVKELKARVEALEAD